MKTVTHLPLLLIIRGLPGSGKSYIAERLIHEFDPQTIISLDPDTIDYDSDAFKMHVEEQIAEGVEPALHDYRFLRAKAYKAIENHKIIVWNQPFTNLEILKKVTTRLEEHAVEHGTTLRIVIVEVSANPETAKQRVADRKAQGGHGPDEARFERFVQEYTTAASLGYSIIAVDGTGNVTDAVQTIVNNLQ